jgi:short-subunit dehydrogenase
VAGLDVLINNAGILHRSDFQTVTLEEVNEAMAINLNVALRLSQVRQANPGAKDKLIQTQKTG